MAVESLPRPLPRAEPRGVSVRWAAGAVLFLAGSLVVGLAVGPVHIGAGSIVAAALSHVPLIHVHSSLDAVQRAVLWQLRAPRVVLAALVGGMLAIAGSAYQGAFRNPLADPYLLGVAAGAGLGATIAIADGSAGTKSAIVPVAAFAGATIAVVFTYALGSSAGTGRSTGALILAGVTVTSFMTAVQTFVQQEHTNSLRDIFTWLLGGFSTATWHDVIISAPYILASSAVLILHRRVLDVLSLGDEEAKSLGVDVGRTRLIIVTAATVGTAAAVSVSGLIGFVGIIVPHTVRLLVSTSYRAVVPLSLVVGGGFVVLTDVLARTVLSPSELPIGVVTAFFGAPFFAIVLRDLKGNPVTATAVELDCVSVSYGAALAIDGLSATFESGSWVALIGPNGAGKTSILRALCRLVSFTGDVRIEGRDARALKRRELARLVALVPQIPETPPSMTVAEYVLLGRTPHLGYFANETHGDRAAAGRALERLDLLHFASRTLGSLSGGELQRAVLARALAQEAQILLLDEPTSALDLGRQQSVLALVDSLRAGSDGMTVIAAMHDLTLAGQYADRLLLLDRGRVVADGTAGDVLSAPNVSTYYGADVRIVQDDDGVFVLPVRR